MMTDQAILLDAMEKIFCWIRMVTRTPRPRDGITFAGTNMTINFQRIENNSDFQWPYVSPNLPDEQAIACILSDIAHNMPSVLAKKCHFFTLHDFAEQCRKASRCQFKLDLWPCISKGLSDLAEALVEEASANTLPIVADDTSRLAAPTSSRAI
ncbi:MAG: hypothetical protein HQL38_14215 [Alphaproteobacteria bacterium]|nr:hypothetical protein [Alphaproteobacteria bacterium]